MDIATGQPKQTFKRRYKKEHKVGMAVAQSVEVDAQKVHVCIEAKVWF